ncbi:hypothetical protein O3M35_007174 [Rhynocoris fuscipes]|uniref:E3 ubiquitin-protein ligase SHPRH n=1 Tax=Rhynocoris fuscipes TaxID=488301 RepID=A0AAW1DFJ8_9HEMI
MAYPEVEELYKFIKQYHRTENLQVYSVSEKKLNVILRQYQVQAVKWMLHREKYSHLDEELVIDDQKVTLPTGGILADEMGLGKTIEVLACILNNPSDIEPPSRKMQMKRRKSRKRKSFSSSDSEEENSDIEQSPKKVRILETTDSDANDSKETKKPVRKVGLKQDKYSMLRQWYEDSVSSISSKATKQKQSSNFESKLRCYCDITPEDETTAQCYECGHTLHLACVGLDYEPEEETFFCSECWTKRDPIPSRATFIITPSSIFQQWTSEIDNHIKGTKLKVLLYDGVKGNNYIQPYALADNDIVITTYQILQSELNYTDIEEIEPRRLRYAKKFHTAKSPLPCIRWWRLCLDEAQMVEGVSTKIATMARQLHAVHRWAVTGTPIQKSLNDLFGLLQYLQVTPFSSFSYWNKLIEDKRNLFSLLGRILWRSNKIDVYHMLGVPDQTVVNHWLSFSPIEGYFYQRMHRECTGKFRDRLFRLNDLSVSLNTVDRKIIHQLMIPLVKLRQACIHPQAVRGRYVTGSGKLMMTMDELMTSMIAKAKLDVDVAMRTVVSCYNGKAALKMILGEWYDAAQHYRLVLQLSEEFKSLASIDTLQMIHTLYNLAEVIQDHRDRIPPTLRDDKLLEDAFALEQSFLERYDKQLHKMRVNVAKMTATVAEQCKGRTLGYSNWWEQVLNWTSDRSDLLERIKADLDEYKIPGQVSLSPKIRSIPAVHKEISVWLANADSLREEVISALRRLEMVPKHELALAAADCHLNESKKKNKSFRYECHLCCAESSLKKYEAAIFSINKQNLSIKAGSSKEVINDGFEDDGDNKIVADLKDVELFVRKKESSWKPSQQERIIKVLSTYARYRKAPAEWVEESCQHLTLLESVRKEFKWLRAEWSTLNHTVSVRDELSMAKHRLRLPTAAEEVQYKNKKIPLDTFIVRPIEIDAQMSKFEWDAADSLVKLRKKAGVLQYLQNLKNNGSVSQEACPVCHEQLNDKWSVMECGHCVCFHCIPTLLDMGSSSEVECPLCRMRTGKGDLSYVVAQRDTPSVSSDEGGNDIKIKGSYSTKVEAITVQLLKLRMADPDVKVLIFSTWEKVLDLLCDALTNNEITFRRFSTLSKYKHGLQQFKTKPVTALLLPLRLGGKGLNIVEATHVFLVEPILNPADELQAAGRVHRIGQTKPTFIHRFVVENTIEERMINLLQGVSSEKNLTLQQLDDLFKLSGMKDE